MGLCPKVYSAKEADDPEAHMRCKGTPKSSMELYVRHENYLRCLFHSYAGENMRQNDDVNVIHSREHELFSIKTSKVSLSCNDSKRYILRDNVHTLVYMAITQLSNMKKFMKMRNHWMKMRRYLPSSRTFLVFQLKVFFNFLLIDVK